MTAPARTDAQILRAAVEKLRDLAKQATPGPWLIEWTYAGDTPQAIFRMSPDHPDDPDLSEGVGVMDEPWDNAWVATMHPGVAAPLADLLGTAAGHEPERAAPDKEPYGCVRCGVSDGAGACDTWLDGLAVARVIVGQASAETSDGVAEKLARVAADRDRLALELGELRKQERVQVRQLRAENDCLRRALDDQAEQLRAQRAWTSQAEDERAEAVARAEKAEAEILILERAEELLSRYAGEAREVMDRAALDRNGNLLAPSEPAEKPAHNAERRAVLDGMVRAGEDAGLYEATDGARFDRHGRNLPDWQEVARKCRALALAAEDPEAELSVLGSLAGKVQRALSRPAVEAPTREALEVLAERWEGDHDMSTLGYAAMQLRALLGEGDQE